jgi:hypothetical protein
MADLLHSGLGTAVAVVLGLCCIGVFVFADDDPN